MFELDYDFKVCEYEVAQIINEMKSIVCTTNNINTARRYYDRAVKYLIDNKSPKGIVYLFDYDKNINLEYFDIENGVA